MTRPSPADAAPSPWRALTAELDAWAADGRVATLWWRDDDAATPTATLTRLLTLAEQEQAPVALAVIPAAMTPDLPSLISATPSAVALQHGYAHLNHAAKGEGAWELGLHRPAETVLAELDRGRSMLARAFGERFVSILVPPWNHIDPQIVDGLRQIGVHGLSTFGPRETDAPRPGLLQVNPHCDPIKWRGGAHFAGTARALDDIVRHLRDRRLGVVDAAEPTGLLTHHRDMDDDSWEFAATLLRHVGAHAAAGWVTVGTLLTDAGAP